MLERDRVDVLGVGVDVVTFRQALERVETFIRRASPPSLVATANAEMVMIAQQDAELFQILNSAALTLADGAGVVWAARHLGPGVPERVAGYDLTQDLLRLSAEKGYRVYWLGASPGVAAAAAARAAAANPGLITVGIHDGYFQPADDAGIIDLVKTARPDILLCALGVPKQEKWLSKYREVLQVPVTIGVGGTFDVMAGNVKRAPLWMQRSGLEWSYRLLRQPSRLFRMMALPRFVLKVWLSAWTTR